MITFQHQEHGFLTLMLSIGSVGACAVRTLAAMPAVQLAECEA